MNPQLPDGMTLNTPTPGATPDNAGFSGNSNLPSGMTLNTSTAPATTNQPPPETNTLATGGLKGLANGASDTLGKIGDFLGISKFGTGIGRAINNSTGEPSTDLKNSMDTLNKSDQQFIDIIHDPNSTPDRIQQAKNALIANNETRSNAVKSYGDITTAGLSNKEVLGSAANTALTVLSAGIPEAKGLLGKAATGAGLGYGMDLANKATNNDQITPTPGLGTAIGASLPFAGALISALAKGTTGVLTGAGKNVIQRAIDNPDAVQSAINDFAKTPEAKQSLVDRAKSAISDFLHQRSQDFGESVNNLTSKVGYNGKQDVVQSFKDNLSKFGGSVGDDNKIAFKNTALTKTDQNNLKQAWSTINKWSDTSAKGMDTLRQAIGNHMDEFQQVGNSRANVVLGKVKSDLTNSLQTNVGGYKNILSDYGQKSQVVKDLSKELSLNSNAKPSTQLSQIMRVFNKDPQVMQNIQRVMGKDGSNKFLNDISGAILSEWIPTGKMGNYIRAFGELGGAAAGLTSHSPAMLGITGATLPASSPRIAGTVATMAGKAGKAGLNVGARRAAIIGASKAQ